MPDPSQFNTDRTHPGRWTITLSNPPINMFVPTTIVELGALMTDLEADRSAKVVVFQSANPDFFIAHLDVSKAAERPEVVGLWGLMPITVGRTLSNTTRDFLGTFRRGLSAFSRATVAARIEDLRATAYGPNFL
jgi:enoyl-CoA hydratase/carnithine racemase